MLPAELTENDLVELEFALPASNRPVRSRVIIRSRSGPCYGFEFVTLSARERADILDFCATVSAATPRAG